MSEWRETEIGRYPIDWEVKKLSEITRKKVTYGIVQPGFHDDNGIPILRVNNIKGGVIEDTDVMKVSSDVASKYTRTQLNGDEILITLVGNLGEVAIVPKKYNGWNIARAVGKIELNDKSDNNWVASWLTSAQIKHFIKTHANTTVQHTLNLSDVENLPIVLPPKKQRDDLAFFITTLNNKITLLRQQNQDLEELAQTLFKRWFVEFEFPNENGEPYKSSGGKMVESELGEIPEGWRIKNIGNLPVEITDYVANGSFASLKDNVTLFPDKEEYALFIRNTDLKSEFKDKVYVDEHSYNFLKKTKLFGGEVIISNVGDVGSVFQCPYFDFPMTLGNNVIMLKSEFNNFLYLYFSGRIGQYLIKGITGGSAQPKFNKTEFKTLELPFPNKEILVKFENQAEKIFKKVTNNKQEIQTLTQLRDTLLPKLMSGEIRIT